MGRRSVALVTMALVLAVAGPAVATQLSDPDDVSGKLDVMTVAGRKADASAPLKIRIETYENWAAGLLRESRPNRVWVLFNTDADAEREYVGVITSSGGKLWLSITGEGSAFEPLRVRHPNGHTLKTTIPGDAPMNPEGTVRIAAKSRFSDDADCSEACRDRAPNGGWLAVAPA